jgi:dipeptidyl aminopeptidase/acylaminoacyl peptidase
MIETPVTFTVAGQQVVGILHRPDLSRRQRPAVLLLHGFTGSKHEAHRLFVLTARALAQLGVVVLRFDFRGSGDSAGDFADMTIATELADARAAWRFLRRQPGVDRERMGVLGMSMGGLVAAYLLAAEPAVKAAVLWCPVGEPKRLLKMRMSPQAATDLRGRGVIDWGGWPVGRAFVEDLQARDPFAALARSRAPVLILHGDADETVPVDESLPYVSARAPGGAAVEREIIPGGSHTFATLDGVAQVVKRSAEWLGGRLKTTMA